MSLIGLDLNASRARAVHGPQRVAPYPLPLEGHESELPLAISLEGRMPVLGRAGMDLFRAMPHLACVDFLPLLGQGRQWTAGKHRLDADGALGLIFDHLARCFPRGSPILTAVPSYLTQDQETRLIDLAQKSRWPLLGAVSAPLAAALAGRDHLPWAGVALVLDADAHALTWSAIRVEHTQARLLSSLPIPRLGINTWLHRLLEQVAHRCILLSRRDPRESAEVEQSLDGQLRRFLEGGVESNRIDIVLQSKSWSQHLMFHPDEMAAFCAPLAREAIAHLGSYLPTLASEGLVTSVVVTHSAALLPGLLKTVEEGLPQLAPPPPVLEGTDFGEDLIDEGVTLSPVWALDIDAVARAAHELAVLVHAGEMGDGPLDVVPLPARTREETETGPARLQFRGQEHLLSGPVFSLGRDPSCNLVFETELYPTVSGRHCEIVLDRRSYTLLDRSRHGTLVNDQPVNQQVPLHPGDWIRLGPVGPVLRFLGNNRLE
jgi:hypothetical protein